MPTNINTLIESQEGFETALNERLSAPNMRYIDPRATRAVARLSRTFQGAAEQGLPALGRTAAAVAGGLGYLNPARWAGAAYGAAAKRFAPRLVQQRTAELWRAGGHGTPSGVAQLDVDTFGQYFDRQRNRLNEVVRPIFAWLDTVLKPKGDLKFVQSPDNTTLQLVFKTEEVKDAGQFRVPEQGDKTKKVPAPSEVYSKLVAPIVDPAQSADVDLGRRLGVALSILAEVEKLTAVLGEEALDDDVQARWTSASAAWTQVSRGLPAVEAASQSNVPEQFLTALTPVRAALARVYADLSASQSALAYMYTRVGLALTQAARAGYASVAVDTKNRDDEFSAVAPKRPTGTDVAWYNPRGWWRDDKNEPVLGRDTPPEPPPAGQAPPEAPPLPPAPPVTPPSPSAPTGPGVLSRVAGQVGGAVGSAVSGVASRVGTAVGGAIDRAAKADREAAQQYFARQGDAEPSEVDEFPGPDEPFRGATLAKLRATLDDAASEQDADVLPDLFASFTALPDAIQNTPRGQQFLADLRQADKMWGSGNVDTEVIAHSGFGAVEQAIDAAIANKDRAELEAAAQQWEQLPAAARTSDEGQRLFDKLRNAAPEAYSTAEKARVMYGASQQAKEAGRTGEADDDDYERQYRQFESFAQLVAARHTQGLR